MIVRTETPDDYDEVYAMVKKSFATANHCDGTEQDYLNAIRDKGSFVPELSLVAETNDMIVGQVVMYEMQIEDEDRAARQRHENAMRLVGSQSVYQQITPSPPHTRTSLPS